MRPSHEFSIDKLHAADSIVTLLARLDTSAFPWEERVAVGVCQARAIDDWLDAYSKLPQVVGADGRGIEAGTGPLAISAHTGALRSL